jgi:fructoselysine-6-P-deglycase FrlB-like protein
MALGAARRDALAAGARSIDVTEAVRPDDAADEPPEDAPDRAAQLLEDILAAPDELAAILDRHARAVAAMPAAAFEHPRWRLVGMGSSYSASVDAATRLRGAGIDAAAEVASGGAPSDGGPGTAAVVVSNSGRTPETVTAADRHRAAGSLVIALTGDPASPLAERADEVLALVGDRAETAGIATLSFRATVAALAMLVDRVEGRAPGAGLPAAVPALEKLLAGRAAWLSAAADALDQGRGVHVLGDAARIALAEQAALVLREGPRIAAQAFDTGDWLHAGLYTLFPGDPLILQTGAASDGAAVATAAARGGRIVAIGRSVREAAVSIPLPDAVLDDDRVRSLVEPLVAELLAAELWARTDATTSGEDRPAG